MNNASKALFGLNIFGECAEQESRGKLSSRFVFPPFSVLNTRDGAWQSRKRLWLSLGIKSEVGRGENLLNYSDTVLNFGRKDKTLDAIPPSQNAILRRSGKYGKAFNTTERLSKNKGNVPAGAGTSIFDPVLCEIIYDWFCPIGGTVVDAFAGGSVRGITAVIMGMRYWGCDLRKEQVAANIEQVKSICLQEEDRIQYIQGDSLRCLDNAPAADFLFTCPPYGDLEVYSDDQRDLSTMEYHAFIACFKRIILKQCTKLKKNRFAGIVISDFRSPTGFYRNFISDTISAFQENGLFLYNDIVLITSVGSLCIRVGRQMQSGRKVGKTHQNVLIFCKGDPFKAAKEINNAKNN